MQQVNLYNADLRPQRVLLPARQILILLAVLIGLLAVTQGYLMWQARQAASAVGQAESRMTALQQRYEKLEAEVAQMRVDERLQGENQRLAQQLNKTRSLLSALQPGGSSALAEQFSSVLEGLARQRQDGLWLTEVGVSSSGLILELRGMVTKPELLPMYLQRLKSESAFNGRQFNVLQLKVPEDRKRTLSFFISTEETTSEARP